MMAQTRRISPRPLKTWSGLNVDTAMPFARPVRPAWSEPSPRARSSTSSRLLPQARVQGWRSRRPSTGCSSTVRASSLLRVSCATSPSPRPVRCSAARPWAARPTSIARSTLGTERSRLLHALADAITANRKELAELESRNVGKAISSVKAEVAGATENFRYYASAIGTIAGRSNPIGGSLLFYSQKEPVGVAAQIVPWNYPLMMATWKLAPALAAGCTVVLKPDPQTPLSVLRIPELAAEVGFPPRPLTILPPPRPPPPPYLISPPARR